MLFRSILRLLAAISLSAAIPSYAEEAPALKYEARISYSPNDDKMKVVYVDRSDGAERAVEKVWLAPADRVTVTIDNTNTKRSLGKWNCYWWWDHKVDRDMVHTPIEQPFSRDANLGNSALKVYVAAGPEAKRVKKELNPGNSKLELGPFFGISNLEVAAAIHRKPPTQNDCKPNKSPHRWRQAPKEIEKAEAGRWFTVSVTVHRIN